ncbi:hypothetical protein FV139_10875 [Parahaliea maris]|uniref:Uncharacterized protein n=1 Tax=Parahaliea maris TaxID=2716870 RepID=A0A5C9A4B6_9GAMM|nr:hypothetical protein [Parahaliea maris]TXS94101.1 hypothetical protein FV139_10875 [Parahaliea maris]
MLRSIIIGSALAISVNAMALPKGKPFQEIAAELTALESEMAALRERLDEGDKELRTAIDYLAKMITLNAYAISSVEDVLVILQTQTKDLASALNISNKALAALALELAQQVAELQAADEALAARLEVLEAIDHARVTGQCPDGSAVVAISEFSLTCEAIEVTGNPNIYRKNVVESAATPRDIIVGVSCDNASDKAYNAGFLASPPTASVSENFEIFHTFTDTPRRQVRATNATRLVAYVDCELANP